MIHIELPTVFMNSIVSAAAGPVVATAGVAEGVAEGAAEGAGVVAGPCVRPTSGRGSWPPARSRGRPAG